MFAIGVLDDDVPELMSVGAAVPELPVVELPVVPEAPIDVPLPVEPVAPVVPPMLEPVPVVAPAVVSVLLVLGVVPIEPELLAVPVVLGEVVVEGIVLELVDVEVSVDEVAASSFLPQALRDRAAIRARAAHCAIGDLIIRNSLWFRSGRIELTAFTRCLRLTLVAGHFSRVVCHCRTL